MPKYGLSIADPRFVRRRIGEGIAVSVVVILSNFGLPGYSDTDPVPHVIEAGALHARYARSERRHGEWAAELRAVPYDHEAAARQAEGHGHPQTAHLVRTGRWPSA